MLAMDARPHRDMSLPVCGGNVGHSLFTVRGVLRVPCGLEETLTYVCIQGCVVCLLHSTLSKPGKGEGCGKMVGGEKEKEGVCG